MDFINPASAAKKVGGGIMDFLTPGGNPADASMGYLDQIEGRINPQFEPYINQGRNAMNDLYGEYGQLMKDPGSILARMGKDYKESPGQGFKREQGLNAINNSAAAGGMAGTMQHQQQAGKLAEDLSSEDFNEYMRNALGLYGAGLKGKEGVSERGYGASTRLADRIAQILSGKAGVAFEGAAGQNKQMSDLIGMLLGAAGGAANGGGMGGAAQGASMAFG
jgi:hypothetical protein